VYLGSHPRPLNTRIEVAARLEQSAELYLNGDQLPLSDIEWKGDREDSHHRYGWLTTGADRPYV